MLFFSLLNISLGANKCPVGLQKRVTEYWLNRANSIFEQSFKIEAPYIQFLTPLETYKIYLAHTVRPEKVKIQKLLCTPTKNGKHCFLLLRIFEKGKESFIRDEWIYLNNMWYHVIKDPIVFSNCFPP